MSLHRKSARRLTRPRSEYDDLPGFAGAAATVE
jgi:hypothetical protein